MNLWTRDKKTVGELKNSISLPMKVYCDKKSLIANAHNPVLHEKTKHVEVDKHFDQGEIGFLFDLYALPSN